MDRWSNYDHDYLAHHGIKGQRWGIRRYQNEDGTLTAEGKARLDKYKSKELKRIDKAYGEKSLYLKSLNRKGSAEEIEKFKKEGADQKKYVENMSYDQMVAEKKYELKKTSQYVGAMMLAGPIGGCTVNLVYSMVRSNNGMSGIAATNDKIAYRYDQMNPKSK